MCNIGKAFSRALTPPGTGAIEAQAEQARIDANRAAEAQAAELAKQTAALQEQTAVAKTAAADALAQQQKAARDAAAAATPSIDSESARKAADARLRQLTAFAGYGRNPTAFGAAPIGYRALTGA